MGQLELFKVSHFVHGTVYMYKTRGCRCDDCRKAATAHRFANSVGALCVRCGVKTWRRSSSADDVVCRSCRKSAPNAHPDRNSYPCEVCGRESGRYHLRHGIWKWEKHRFCSDACTESARPPVGRKDPYYARSEVVPGLKAAARKRLLDRWRRQGRSCFYCDGPTQTVDHVVPLVQGGTNYEGNLVPACRSCNGSKSGYLLVEWRLRRGAIKSAA